MKRKPAMSRGKRPAATRNRRGSKPFPIVGIGASAGGFEAFRQLLKELPADTGMGFVFVQHLDPQHESALTQLLGRITSIPVREVTNNLQVEPNNVYVIPPNTSLGITKGVLKLQPRSKAAVPHRSIDFFFEALAQDQRERAIGVVLSGTATDGTLGLEAIKAEGGITFAQNETAKYDSMPRSAVTAGCVDFVLKPEDIAKELARIAKHPLLMGERLETGVPEDDHAAATEHEDDKTPLPSGGSGTQPTGAQRVRAEAEARRARAGEDGFRKILVLLRNHSGVDFSLYKSSTIQRRITRRMVLNKLTSLDDYANYLRGNAKELDALYSDVLISVTSFFRNPDAFDVLKRKVFPKLFQRRGDDPFRVWVLGCSTGQEAYSIAMTFVEAAEKAPKMRRLQVFATDLNDALLDKARQGLYAKSLAQDISPERLHRFFIEEEGGYRISKALRDMVVFARQNVISDPPFSRLDLVSCRNLLIYLEPSLQRKALPTFHYALRPEGFLLLGASESIGGFTELFEPVDRHNRIFVKKAVPTPAFHVLAPRERGERPISVPRIPVEKSKGLPPGKVRTMPGGLPEIFQGELNAQREADRVTVNQFAPPGVLVNTDLQIIQFRGPTAPFLEPPSGKASFHVLKMAREGLMLPLRGAINQAKRDNRSVRKENIRIKQDGRSRMVNIEIVPLKNLKECCFLILFERSKVGGKDTEQRAPGKQAGSKKRRGGKRAELSRVEAVEQELVETRDFLQSSQEQYEAANEELQASNEEVTSANEELQSINEELETSKEELESTNEELTTVNEEMVNRNAELARANNDLANLHASIDIPMLVVSRDLTLRYITPPAEKIFSLLATDTGRPLSSIRHKLVHYDDAVARRQQAQDTRYPLEDIVRDVIDDERGREDEVRDIDGNRYALRVRPYMTAENKIDGAVIVLVDVTDIKRADTSSASLAAIVNYSEDAIIGKDLNGTITSWNYGAERLFGYTAGEAIGKSILMVIPEDRHPEEAEIMARIRRGEQVSSFETVRRRKDGKLLDISLTISPIKDAAGNNYGASTIARDITARKRAEAEARRRVAQQKQLFILADQLNRLPTAGSIYLAAMSAIQTSLEAPRASILILEPDGVMRFKAWRGLSDEYRAAVEGHSPWTSDTRDAQPVSINDVAKAEVDEELRRVIKREGIGAMGFIPLNYQGKLLGKFMVYYNAPHEFTEEEMDLARTIANQLAFGLARKISEDSLREAHDRLSDQTKELERLVGERTVELSRINKQLEAFVYSIAHDLRGPLRSMQSFSELLLEEKALSGDGKDYASRIHRSAQFMDRLLTDLLGFSRMTQRRHELGPVNLGPIVQSVVTQLHAEIQEKNAQLDIAGDWPMVVGNESTLTQVMLNLTANALKFVEPGTTPVVRLRPEEHDGTVRVWVEDNGIGIDGNHHSQIFRVFSRLHGDKYPGTGIGLAIVQRGIEDMGGHVGLESKEGEGSRFWFELPKPAPPPAWG